MNDVEQLQLIRSRTLAQLADLRTNPKPTYTVDGQQVAWESYIASLERTIDWCDAKLRGCEPFEFQSQGYTS